MIDAFDNVTDWTAVTDTSGIALDTTTFIQGTGCLKFNKSGTGTATGVVRRKLRAPFDYATVRRYMPRGSVKMRHMLSSVSDHISTKFEFVYRVDSAGAVEASEAWTFASLSAGTWNSLVLGFGAATQTGSVTDAMRSRVIELRITVTLDDPAATLSDIRCDAWQFIHEDPASGVIRPAPLGLVIFDSTQRLLLPPFDVWQRSQPDEVKTNATSTQIEKHFQRRNEQVRFGHWQVRNVYEESNVHSLEESLRRFDEYASRAVDWKLSRDANQLVDTTLSSGASAGAMSVALTSVVDLEFMGLSTPHLAYADLRIGPSTSRRYEACRATGVSGSTVYLDRPLCHTYLAGAKVRSYGYYPAMGKMSEGPSVREEDRVVFDMTAREVG